jgi:hypothetical protein
MVLANRMYMPYMTVYLDFLGDRLIFARLEVQR